MTETIRVHEWMKKHQLTIEGQSIATVTSLVSETLKLSIAPTTVRSIGRELNLQFKLTKTKDNLLLKEILIDLVHTIGVPNDHDIFDKINSL